MNITDKRKKATAYLLSSLKKIDKLGSGENVKRYEELFASMSDNKFDKFMKDVRDETTCIYTYFPNMTKRPSLADTIGIAEQLDIKIMHRIKLYDSGTDSYYLSNEEYPIVRVPVRRQQQFLDKKMSVPSSDKKINAMTGQVAWEDQSATITNPEIQALVSKGLPNVLKEVVTVRGGNIEAWSGEMKQQAEETGSVDLDIIGQNSISRSAVVAEVLIECMMLDTNLTER